MGRVRVRRAEVYGRRETSRQGERDEDARRRTVHQDTSRGTTHMYRPRKTTFEVLLQECERYCETKLLRPQYVPHQV